MKIKTFLRLFDFKEKKLTYREKFTIFSSLAIIILTTTLFIRPTLQSISDLSIELLFKEKELAVLAKKRKMLNELSTGSNVEVFESYMHTASLYLPTEKPALDMMFFLIVLAGAENVELSAFSLSPGVIKENEDIEGVVRKKSAQTTDLADFSLQFSVVGERSKLLSFIEKIGQMPPMTKVETLNIFSHHKAEGVFDAIIGARFTMSVFYLPLIEIEDDKKAPLVTVTQNEEILLQDLKRAMAGYEQYQNPFEVDVRETIETLGKANPFAVYQPGSN